MKAVKFWVSTDLHDDGLYKCLPDDCNLIEAILVESKIAPLYQYTVECDSFPDNPEPIEVHPVCSRVTGDTEEIWIDWNIPGIGRMRMRPLNATR